MRYFDHDVTASMDTKIFELRLLCGGAAVDAYWYLLERIYMDEKPLRKDNASAMQVHSHCLCTDRQTLMQWIDSMVSIGLFVEYDETDEIHSIRAFNNIEEYHEKAEKRSSAAKKRWDSCKSNANAMQVHSKCNASAMQDDSSCNANKRKEKKRKECIATQSNATPTPCESGAEDGADVAGEVPHCSACDAIAIFKPESMCFVCPNCGTLHSKDEVVFK